MALHTLRSGAFLVTLFFTVLQGFTRLNLQRQSLLLTDDKLYVCEKYCPDASYQPKFDGLQPMTDLNLPPYIYHIKPDRKWTSIVDCIVTEGKVPADYVKRLIGYGAIYFTRNANNGHKKPIRLLQDQPCDASSYIRVHINPRRFVAANSIDWRNQFISLSSINFTVVNKPSSVPSLSTVDNAVENVQTQVEMIGGRHSKLLSLGRLDTCTSGVLVFAETKASATYFHNLIRDRKIDKGYLVLTKARPSTGILKHWFPQPDSDHRESQNRHKNAKPGLLAVFNHEKETDELVQGRYCIAELHVISVREVAVDMASSTASSTAEEPQHYYESEVKLITGRTHQIRVQFAAEGWPVVGDSRYEPVAGLKTRLHSSSSNDGNVKFGPEPKKIGLHCCELEVPLLGPELGCKEVNRDGIEAVQHGIHSTYYGQTGRWSLRCPSPWWRTSPDVSFDRL